MEAIRTVQVRRVAVAQEWLAGGDDGFGEGIGDANPQADDLLGVLSGDGDKVQQFAPLRKQAQRVR